MMCQFLPQPQFFDVNVLLPLSRLVYNLQVFSYCVLLLLTAVLMFALQGSHQWFVTCCQIDISCVWCAI